MREQNPDKIYNLDFYFIKNVSKTLLQTHCVFAILQCGCKKEQQRDGKKYYNLRPDFVKNIAIRGLYV